MGATNGRVERKTLASQLDRLDNVIDALADGVNQAVVDAVRQAVTVAVQQAVEMVVREVLANPELLRRLTGTPVAPVVAAAVEVKAAQPSVLMKLLSWFGSGLGTVCRRAGESVGIGWSSAAGFFGGIRERGRSVWMLRRSVALSLLIGLAVGMAGYLAGPFLSSLALGLCSSVMSLLTILAAPFVRMWNGLKGEEA